MKIAMAQIEPHTGDLDGNADKICGAIYSARQQECDLVVFPETVLTGYMTGDLLEVDDFIKDNQQLMHERIAPQCNEITAIVGFVATGDDNTPGEGLYNAAAVIQDGRIIDIATKQNLCRYRYYDETRYFNPGDTTTVVQLDIRGITHRIGVLICEDFWDTDYPNHPYRQAA